MIKTFLLLVGILVYGLTYAQDIQNADHYFKKAVFTSQNQEKLPYRLLYPLSYDPIKKYPLVLFLHGAGSQGDDNESQLMEVPQVLLKASADSKYACFVLAPQCRKEDAWAWFPKYPLCETAKEPSKSCRLTLDLIDGLIAKLPIDQQRIYVTGLSLGGEGTFDMITQRPHFFAAALPVCGIADSSKVNLMKHTPLWIFHGDSDEINSVEYSRNLVKAFKRQGLNCRYSEYAGVKHDSWTRAYQEPELLKWMFNQKLKRMP